MMTFLLSVNLAISLAILLRDRRDLGFALPFGFSVAAMLCALLVGGVKLAASTTLHATALLGLALALDAAVFPSVLCAWLTGSQAHAQEVIDLALGLNLLAAFRSELHGALTDLCGVVRRRFVAP